MQITINTETGEFAELLRILCEYRVPTPGPNATPDEDPEEVPEPRPEPLIHAELTKLDAICRDVGYETAMSIGLDGEPILSVKTGSCVVKYGVFEDSITNLRKGYVFDTAREAFWDLLESGGEPK